MAFAVELWDSLQHRECQSALEFAAGESLATVLNRHLLAVESAAETDLLTSILLLDADGKRLVHGAAPSLPCSYCEAIDGVEIGPDVGSCGAAAYLDQAIYVTDVATDPLWKDYRDLALEHGLRACWSTPIHDDRRQVIGTFAIYHLTPRSPTAEEIEAIRMITGHVAQAILWSRAHQDEPGLTAEPVDWERGTGNLRLIGSDDAYLSNAWGDHFDEQQFRSRLQAYAAKLDRFAALVESREFAGALKAIAADCRHLVNLIGTAPHHPGADRLH